VKGSRDDRASILHQLAPITPPAWVASLVATQPDAFSVISRHVADAAALASDAFTEVVAEQYRHIIAALADRHRHAVRIWNFVPQIQARTRDGDRYMAFNAGRFAAFADWFGDPGKACHGMPTASAVGTAGASLSIHVLAANVAGTPIENPRQIPSYRYSRRYGAQPPCFARATKLHQTLFIGGTASIVGEDSHHVGDVGVQTRETLRNLAALIAAAARLRESEALAAVSDVRVHVSDPQHAERVLQILTHALPDTSEMEFVEAQLCRRELLVEIEGRAICG
jgi:chorismate lyase / 3-hydroxybenzoate synthase